MGGLPLPALGLFALAYSGLVLFALAHALKRAYPPRRAAWSAFGLSAAVHGGTVFLAEPVARAHGAAGAIVAASLMSAALFVLGMVQMLARRRR